MRRPSITIGIPAYNEAANIEFLLRDIVRQHTPSFTIKEILVASDGSTDGTSTLARHVSDKRIRVFSYTKRKGKAFRQNQLIKRAKGSILVLLDGDVIIRDSLCIERLITPLLKGNADMTSASIRELPSRTFFESILDVSMQLKNRLFASFKDGHNMYSCHGPARAFSRAFFSKLQFPVSEGEDMYSYFACVFNGFRFRYVGNAAVEYRLPSTFTDHKRQSIRFRRSQQLYRRMFGHEFISREMRIPLSAYAVGCVRSLPFILKHPVEVSLYVLVLGTMQVSTILSSQTFELWNATSSKLVRM